MVSRKGPEGQTPERREGGDHTAAPGTNGSQVSALTQTANSSPKMSSRKNSKQLHRFS